MVGNKLYKVKLRIKRESSMYNQFLMLHILYN